MLNAKLAGIALILTAGGIAYADDDTEPVTCPPQPPPQTASAEPLPPSPQPTYVAPPPAEGETVSPNSHLLGGFGATISAGGGVTDFAKSGMRDVTNIGGSWNVSMLFGSRSYIAGEVAYIGSAQSIHGPLGFNSNSTLVGNGAQADLRLNGTIDYPLQPFVYGGAAWRHYSATNENPNLVSLSDNVLEVPAGLGVAAYVDGLAIEVRGEYRFAFFGNDMIPGVSTSNGQLDRWGVSGNIGYEF